MTMVLNTNAFKKNRVALLPISETDRKIIKVCKLWYKHIYYTILLLFQADRGVIHCVEKLHCIKKKKM